MQQVHGLIVVLLHVHCAQLEAQILALVVVLHLLVNFAFQGLGQTLAQAHVAIVLQEVILPSMDQYQEIVALVELDLGLVKDQRFATYVVLDMQILILEDHLLNLALYVGLVHGH